MRTYDVRRGDTLTAIAARFSTSVEKIARANRIDDPNVILVGQRLKVGDAFEPSGAVQSRPQATGAAGAQTAATAAGAQAAGARPGSVWDRDPPKHDYRRVQFRGVVVNRRTLQMIKRAETLIKKLGGPTPLRFYQGSYHRGVGASAGTHDGGGALDVVTRGMTGRQRDAVVKGMRAAGFAAWDRPTMSPPHIHAIAIGDRQASRQAKSQVAEYLRGGDGLSGNARDPDRNVGRPIPLWARDGR